MVKVNATEYGTFIDEHDSSTHDISQQYSNIPGLHKTISIWLIIQKSYSSKVKYFI